MASTAENEATVHTSPDILTMEDQVCDVEMLPVPEASSPELPLPMIVEEALIRAEQQGDFIRRSHDSVPAFHQQFVVPFPDPASTLTIHGSSARSDQGVERTSSSQQIPLRAASSVNHSEAVQSPNISHGVSTLNPTTAPNPPPRHLFNNPYEYELEKIRIEEEHLKKSVEETTSLLMAELDRKIAEARSQLDRESQELDAACKAQVMEVEAYMGLVRTGSLLGNAFVSKCSEKSASNDLAAARAAMISQHSTQQQQAVQTNTQMSSIALPRVRPQQEVQASRRMSTSSDPPQPSVITVDDPTASPPHLPRRTTPTQPSPMSHQPPTHVNLTAPQVTAVEPQTPNHLRPLARFPRPTTTQPSPASQPQSNTNVNSTAPPRPSVTTEALPLPLHSPLSNTPRPRPRPVISNLTPSSSSSPPVRGPAPILVRAMPPHLARRRAPHLWQNGSSPPSMSATATTHPRAPVQEQEQQQQQQGKSKDGLVHLSDED